MKESTPLPTRKEEIGMKSQKKLCGLLAVLVLWGVSGAGAGDGVVALQTAAASCGDDSSNIYVDCGNGTVTDNRTGLVWLANASCLDAVDWDTAMEFVVGLSDLPGNDPDDCGLSDGSSPGEWRLPSKAEWAAMRADALGEGGSPDCTTFIPTITDDTGQTCWVFGPSSFSGVQSANYWSSTTDVSLPGNAWGVDLIVGVLNSGNKPSNSYVWPVRGGQ